jgi:hypothetical protein
MGRRQIPQPMHWNSSQTISSSAHDQETGRRSRYSRDSYNPGNCSSSSGSFASANGNMSTSQPSPSSSATSTASSLRTPPDLLLNGSTLASSLGAAYVGQKGLVLSNGKGKASSKLDFVHLSVEQLEGRLHVSVENGKPLISCFVLLLNNLHNSSASFWSV